jgi:hypothetical protein
MWTLIRETGSAAAMHTVKQARFWARFIPTLLLFQNITFGEEPGTILLRQKLPDFPVMIRTEVSIGGQKCVMVVDSGTASTTLDTSLKNLLTEESRSARVRDENAGRMAELYRSLPLQAQSIRASEPLVWIADFSGLRKLFGGRLDGLLGVAQLKSGKMLLNRDEGFLEIHSGGWKIDGKGYDEIAFDTRGADPTFLADIERRACEIRLDTGFNRSITLEASDFDFLVKSGVIEPSKTKARDQIISGEKRSKVGWFLKGELMGKSLKGIEVSSAPDEFGVGSIGLEWLYGFNIEIDFESHRFRYRIRPEAKSPLVIELMTGARLSYVNNGAQVHSLRPDGGGAAEAAGLKPGDVIERFGSLNETELNCITVAETVTTNAGKTIPIRFARQSDGANVDGTLSLPPPILVWDFAGRDIFNKKPISAEPAGKSP